ncbi:hypothetical protein C8D92_106156 [Tamilnaduibacter salinus]|uniref:Uncharacterized protein n=1 Tax=Tamilnaduibacter salinus TaxID=1484056 RepID=A0A2A2I3E7_9GAMM|nr:hypothetical protein [Tamilnaduibacter salinus]PAV26541.1 hypothetical protein CF392_04860 [Tamilnaduibacter salinus]PVY75895.1 hypothetical protein C8D92_106156 [Tamilnaduibacter salinus]
MRQFRYILALLAFVAGLAMTGPVMAADEHGGDAVETESGDEHAGEEAEEESDEHAGEEAEDESDEHAGDSW